ncbi:MAG: hypothetical protein H6741_21255 [Alphaproteobacteria bacterium]|nr:hypothetical protein [Alphaproteobacteria bacterium]
MTSPLLLFTGLILHDARGAECPGFESPSEARAMLDGLRTPWLEVTAMVGELEGLGCTQEAETVEEAEDTDQTSVTTTHVLTLSCERDAHGVLATGAVTTTHVEWRAVDGGEDQGSTTDVWWQVNLIWGDGRDLYRAEMEAQFFALEQEGSVQSQAEQSGGRGALVSRADGELPFAWSANASEFSGEDAGNRRVELDWLVDGCDVDAVEEWQDPRIYGDVAEHRWRVDVAEASLRLSESDEECGLSMTWDQGYLVARMDGELWGPVDVDTWADVNVPGFCSEGGDSGAAGDTGDTAAEDTGSEDGPPDEGRCGCGAAPGAWTGLWLLGIAEALRRRRRAEAAPLR